MNHTVEFFTRNSNIMLIHTLTVLTVSLIVASSAVDPSVNKNIGNLPHVVKTPLEPVKKVANPVHEQAVHVGNAPNKPVSSGKRHKINLEDTVECAADIKRFCSDRMQSNNFMILDCLQDSEKTDDKVSLECHHFLWKFKMNLTMDIAFDKGSEEACQSELTKMTDCNSLERGKGLVIPCLVEHYEEIETAACQSYINKMATIIFSDYRFMQPFIKDCGSDIDQFQCGRMESDDDDSPHSQGAVVSCLNDKLNKVEKKCKHALLKVAEIQSDDYHMDRPLYYNCKDDREALCPEIVSGDGRVYQCLYQHLEDKKLSHECKKSLIDRQQIIDEDIKADNAFYSACQKDIKSNNCTVRLQTEETLDRTDILLCLENAENNGVKLEPHCVKEMFVMRTELIQNYKISPELVSNCKLEIQTFCEDGLQPEGESLHCLMQAVKDKKTRENFSPKCRAALEDVLHVVKPGDDIRLDPPLQRACGDVVTAACADRPKGHGDIITCLLDNLDHDDMTDECEEKLLEIQYFAVRDFQLDNHLFKQCKKDAKKLCNLSFDQDSTNPEQGPLVFTCLYRQYRSEDPQDQKPSRGCIHEMRRVMRERGKRINLHPDIEAACIDDLSEFCSDNEEHEEESGEIECLQDNIEDLKPECQKAVLKFSEEETEDPEMNRILMKHCTPMIKEYCQPLLDSDVDPTQVLACLIEHKHARDMDNKCAAGIEHYQIISSKVEFKFSHKFREACEKSVSKLCHSKQTKFEVVSCLSEHVVNDTLREVKHRVDKQCQKQLKVELLQRSESINLDPQLKKACKADIKQQCADIHTGEAQVVECLKKHKNKLSDSCHRMIFKRQQEQAHFSDYAFLHVCKRMIKTYCRLDLSESDLLDCLKDKKDDEDFDPQCRKIVIEREVEQAQDYRLDISLQKACQRDIKKFCSNFLTEDGKELNGKVVNCLKKHFHTKEKPLSQDCEAEVRSRVKESAMDINLNPVVMKSCKAEIREFCKDEAGLVERMSVDEEGGYEVHGHGRVIECLRKNFQKLTTQDCKREIAYLITESRVDVHVDPMLNNACTKELISLCGHVKQGQGRQMSCLLANLETDPRSLGRDCRVMLTGRKDLWEYAAQIAPAESLSELYEEIRVSPQRNYFFAIFFTAVGIIFVIGLTCGRVTKRVRAEIKNKWNAEKLI